MSFDWMSTPAPDRSATAKKHEEMLLRELEERAALLFRLKASVDDARSRLRANLQWEHDGKTPAALLAQVDALVDRVWKRGATRHGSPSLE